VVVSEARHYVRQLQENQNMKTTTMKRITIVVDNSVERQIVKEIHDLGATGYTCTVVHGNGAKGARPNHWAGPNAKIEVIGTSQVTERILEHIEKNYFGHFATIVYLDEVEVLRAEKFGV
jgi:nitrogen regulatory protein PII